MRTPHEIVTFANQLAMKKAQLPLPKMIISGFLGGAYLAMGATVSLLGGFGFPEAAAGNPAFVKLLMGLLFPIGLTLIVLAGAELFTSNCAMLTPNLLSDRLSIREVLRNWTVVILSNAVGVLLFGYFMVHLTGVSSTETMRDGLYSIAEAKCSNSFGITLLKGIGANWLVCLAVWLSLASEMVMGKIIGIWLPIMAFVIMGFEHSVANIFYLPLAMWEGANITISDIFTNNLIATTIGNVLGGSIFVGISYWYLYDSKTKELE